MEQGTDQQRTIDVEPDVPALDGFTSYEDGDHLVICDRSNPTAWIRADDVRDLDV